MKTGKRILVLVLALSVATNAFAFWGLLAPVGTAIMWLGRVAASNVALARAVEWSIYLHGAAISFISWKNSQDAAGETSAPIKARLTLQPNTTSQRDNPDPSKWDSPVAGGRNPTPKSSFAINAGLTPMPSTYPQVVTDIGGEGSKTYWDGKHFRDEIVSKNSTLNGKSYSGLYATTLQGYTGYFYVFDTVRTADCPTGYTKSDSTTCSLTADPSTIQKPAGVVPCEVLQNSDGTWDIDAQNPECASLSSALSKSNAGRTISFSKGDGTWDSVTSNADGSRTISTGGRLINLGPPAADGTSPITGISDSGVPASGGGSGAGAGSGSGGGGNSSSGTGNAVCGAPPLPACSVAVDDSGFNGKDNSVSLAAEAAKSKLDDRLASLQSEGAGENNFGLDGSWIPSVLPGPAVQCSDIKWEPSISHGPLAGVTASLDVDWCSKIDLFREYYAWMFSVVTTIAIVLLFFSSNGSVGRSSK